MSAVVPGSVRVRQIGNIAKAETADFSLHVGTQE